jgi:redox-regulated HSP33 family molecular chaperone
MEKCMRCGHELIISGNFMLSEVNCEELSEEDDAMVTNAHCPFCGAGYELYDTPESEKYKYPYWNENNLINI